MLLQTASRTVCETSESITKPPHFRVPGTHFAHLKASYQIKTHDSTWSEAKPLGMELQLVTKTTRELNPQINIHENKPKWFFKERDRFSILRIHGWQHRRASHNVGAIGISCWGGWAGQAGCTNLMAAPCSIGRSLAQGMALCTSCTPMPRTKKMCKSVWSRGRGALLYFTHTHQSVPYRVYRTRRWNWLGRDDEFWGGFLPFSFIASGYCIFKPVLIALNMHVFTYIYIKVPTFLIYICMQRQVGT